MSECLLGHFLFIPEKLNTADKKLILDKVSVYEKYLKSPFIKKLIFDFEKDGGTFEDPSSIEHQKVILELSKNLPSAIVEYTKDFGSLDKILEFKDFILNDIKEFIKKPEILSTFDDINWTVLNVFNREITVYFAGDVSYGDVPEGLGYQLLTNLWDSGIGEILKTICFPNNSSHFIENIIK